MKVDRREAAKRAVEGVWQDTGQAQILPVKGESMGNTIPSGARVRVAFSRNPSLKRGDIVYLRRGNLRVVHRLLAVLGPVCIEKGDALLLPRPCLRSKIIGRVTDVEPRQGELPAEKCEEH